MGLTQAALDGLDYHDRPDEDLVSSAKAGDNLAMEFLLNKYKNFVRIKAKSYFLIGADREDIIQEGMIGLYKAVRDFKADKLSSFRAFAELCITRQIITAIKTATRQKHIPLNQYISLNKPIYDEDSERTLLDVMASQKTSLIPKNLVINQAGLRGHQGAHPREPVRPRVASAAFVSRRQELPGDGTRPKPARQVDRQRAATREAEDREEPRRNRIALKGQGARIQADGRRPL